MSVPIVPSRSKYRFIAESLPTNYEFVRNQIAANMGDRFTGWDNEFDRQFDWHSRFFLLFDHDRIVAGTRIVFAGSFWPQSRLPLECSDGSVEINTEKGDVAEFSGLWFEDVSLGKLVCALATEWVMAFSSDPPIYAVYEQGNRVIKRIYTRSFGLEEVPHAAIQYNGFRYSDSNLPVPWSLTLDNPATRRQRVTDALNGKDMKALTVNLQQDYGIHV